MTRRDAAGRTIAFDVPSGTDVSAYAATLRHALHGDEIESVTIRVVSPGTLARLCGRRNMSWYLSPRRDDGEIRELEVGR